MTEQPQVQDPFEVPEGYTGDIGNPLDTEGVRLPFQAPYVWWMNGLNQFKKELDVRYFGGWCMGDEDMGAAIELLGASVPPLGWIPYEMVNGDGDNYTAFASRFIYLAIFGSRKRWDTDKNRGHYQVLGYMAYPNENKIMVPFSPVVLTCKATAGMFLEKAVIEFSSKTQGSRRKFANNLPISAFYACFGTFGDQRVEQEVGKDTKKKVTPLRLWLPKQIDEPFLRSFFVGKEIAAQTAELRKDAREWLDAWKQPVQAEAPANGNRKPAPQADPIADHMPEMPPEPPVEDGMPY